MGMRIPALMSKQGSLAMVNVPYGEVNMKVFNPRRQKEKVVVVMGATGTGKSKLSIDLATHFASEIINADKMQVYEGLDIVTNKITTEEQRGVPHHLLGVTSPYVDFSVSKFCGMASLAADSIVRRDRLPIIVGGSNSYIEALVGDNLTFRSKYECCFLWVDVSMPVLHSFVSERVDKMVASGMVEEVKNFFDPSADYSQGIRKAIGVPEFDRYLRHNALLDGEERREKLLQEAISEIKVNTCKLACRQREKIHRLRNVKGWKIHRLDATEAFRKKGKGADEAWSKHVSAPSTMIVAQFLSDVRAGEANNNVKGKATPFRMPVKRTAAAAASR